ncbi:MAG: ATP-binding protein, partial [Methanococcaceae archaeon]
AIPQKIPILFTAASGDKTVEISISLLSGNLTLNLKDTITPDADPQPSQPLDGKFPLVLNSGLAKLVSELKHQEDLLELVLAALPVGVWILDEKGKTVTGNKAAEKIWTSITHKKKRAYGDFTGYRYETGRKIEEDEWAGMRAIYKGETTLNEIVVLEGQDKERKTVLNSAVPILDESEKIIGAVVVNQDITEMQRVEEIIKSKKDFEGLAENSPDLISRFTPDFKLTYINKVIEQLTGRPAKSLTGKKFSFTGLSPANRALWKKNISLVFESGTESALECEFSTINGKRFFNIRFIPEFNDVNMVSSVLVISRDITESARLQNELKESESKLLEAQKLAHIGSFELDVKTGQIEWTEEIYNIYEIDPQKQKLIYEDIIRLIHPEDLGRVIEEIKEGVEKKRDVETEFRIILPGGKIKNINYRGRSVFNKSGQLVKRIGIIMDITERIKIQIQLENTIKELERSNTDLEQFAFVASHDLQEPIRMIGSYIQLFERNFKQNMNPEAAKFINFVHEGATRLQLLVRDLLNYSRIGTNYKSFSGVDVKKIIEGVLLDLELLIRENQVEIILGKLPVITADQSQIRQLFQNLIINAVKFRGKNPPIIHISCRERNNDWLFYVKDNGIGIKPEHGELIFVVFQRLNERSDYPGTGIGLAICKRIVERHNGRIWVESQSGQGSVFYFTIAKK